MSSELPGPAGYGTGRGRIQWGSGHGKGGGCLPHGQKRILLCRSPVLTGQERLERTREIGRMLYGLFSSHTGKEAEKPPEG